jgi:hypothetical protein
MVAAVGILTSRGGMTSHAAVVARGMGKPCVAGCEGLTLDIDAKTARLGNVELREGDVITLDGGTGRVIVGAVPLVPPQINEDFQTVLDWADDVFRDPLVLEVSPYFQPNPEKPPRYAHWTYKQYKTKPYVRDGYFREQYRVFREIAAEISDQGLF